MDLTVEEREAIRKGRNPQIPDSRVPFVIVREDLLDPFRIRADYSPCNPDDLSVLTADVLDDEDWTIPEGQ